jgi:hypothetical protein
MYLQLSTARLLPYGGYSVLDHRWLGLVVGEDVIGTSYLGTIIMESSSEGKKYDSPGSSQ